MSLPFHHTNKVFVRHLAEFWKEVQWRPELLISKSCDISVGLGHFFSSQCFSFCFLQVNLALNIFFKNKTKNRKTLEWNYVWCQTILDCWTFYQEVLGTVGAFSNFRCVTVRGRGLWQELLRGRESIRQGSLQSGQLLKMQQHHYSLTEPTTPVSFSASLFISLWIIISSFFFSFEFFLLQPSVLFLICLLHIPFSPLSCIRPPSSTYFSITKLAGVSFSHPSVHVLTCWSFFIPI